MSYCTLDEAIVDHPPAQTEVQALRRVVAAVRERLYEPGGELGAALEALDIITHKRAPTRSGPSGGTDGT